MKMFNFAVYANGLGFYRKTEKGGDFFTQLVDESDFFKKTEAEKVALELSERGYSSVWVVKKCSETVSSESKK